MNLNDDRNLQGQAMRPLNDSAVRRELTQWIVERCAACAGILFLFMVHATTGPFPFGPNYLFSTLVTVVMTVIVGIVLTVRAYLHVQRIFAERAGVTLLYRLGSRLRILLSRMSR